MSGSAALPASELTTIARDLMAAKMYSVAAVVMLLYDIAITMGDEIERIWMRKFTPMTVIWFLNRYITPLAFIVVVVSFNDPWPEAVCHRYVLFPEGLKVVTSFVIGVIFILRLYAIYSRSLTVAILGGLCLVAELGVKIYSFTDGIALQLPEGLVGCILVGRSMRFAFTWVAELAFDTLVFFATFYRVYQLNRLRQGTHADLIDRILRDGVIYFAVIFAANLLTVLIYMLAPPNIKAINASFSYLITNLMVSRLILNLREGVNDGGVTLQSGICASQVEWVPRYELDSRISHGPRSLFTLRQDLSTLSAIRRQSRF